MLAKKRILTRISLRNFRILFGNSKFYKIGFIDGMNVKKDIEIELGELKNGKSDE